jgi:hypothetical protein
MAQMDIRRLGQGDPSYPSALQLFLGDCAPTTLTTLGNLDILRQKKLALFCSVKCPGHLILQTYDLARILRDADAVFVTHAAPGSKMEQFCHDMLTSGKPLLTLESDENTGLIAWGARPVQPENISRQWATVTSEAPTKAQV